MKFGILDCFYEPDIERGILGIGHEMIGYACRNEHELPDDIAELDGCMIWHYLSISEETLLRLKNCRAIVRVGVGYDSVDYVKAGELGIPVFNIPDYGTNDVADHCFALVLASCRSLFSYNNSIRKDIKKNWNPEIGGEIHRLTNANFGIIGMGRIGSAVAARAKAFGMKVKFYDPYLPDGYDKSYQIERVGMLDELFAVCDYVSVHAPLTGETKGMVHADILARAKDGLVLINTARGGIVNLDDVYFALKSGKLRAFAADVLESEPPDENHLLVKAFIRQEKDITDKVILTPHAAFYAEESRREMREKAGKALLDCANNIPMRNCVNQEWLINPRAKVCRSHA